MVHLSLGNHSDTLSGQKGPEMVAVIIIVVVVVLLALVLVGSYNGIVRMRNQVDNGWSQIDVQIKRRADLIPNLVETVKGYAAHESRGSSLSRFERPPGSRADLRRTAEQRTPDGQRKSPGVNV